MPSASEAECTTLFINVRDVIALQTASEEIGIHNCSHLMKCKIQSLMESVTPKYSKNDPRRCICGFIGCEIDSKKTI